MLGLIGDPTLANSVCALLISTSALLSSGLVRYPTSSSSAPLYGNLLCLTTLTVSSPRFFILVLTHVLSRSVESLPDVLHAASYLMIHKYASELYVVNEYNGLELDCPDPSEGMTL